MGERVTDISYIALHRHHGTNKNEYYNLNDLTWSLFCNNNNKTDLIQLFIAKAPWINQSLESRQQYKLLTAHIAKTFLKEIFTRNLFE